MKSSKRISLKRHEELMEEQIEADYEELHALEGKLTKVQQDLAQEHENFTREIDAHIDTKRRLMALIAAVGPIRLVGSQMANLCANLSQPSWQWHEQYRQTMKDLYQEWDEAVKAVRAAESSQEEPKL